MGAVVLYMSISVDGFVAGPDDGPEHGLGVGGEVLHGWLADGGVEPGRTGRPTRPARWSSTRRWPPAPCITGRRTFEFAGGGAATTTTASRSSC